MKKTLLALSFLASLTATAQTTFKVGDVVYQTTSPKTVQTYKFESKNTEVNIPQTVSHEGKEYTVTAIGEESFSWSKLQKITLPQRIDSIKSKAFVYTDLSQITLPDKLTYIGDRCFSSCKMSEITIPATVTKIGNGAFFSCTNLEKITFYNGLREIGESAFYHLSKLKTLELPATVISIGKAAFARSEKLTTLQLPTALKRLGDGAFMQCPLLTSVTLPHGFIYLGDEVFMKCSNLNSITLPATLEHWGISVIAATAVKEIKIDGKNPTFVVENNCLYNKDKTLLYAVPMRGMQTLSIPEGVLGVNGGAAWGAELQSINFPSTLLAIDKYAFESTQIAQLTLPNNITFIGEQAFSDIKISELTLPESVTYIDDGVFASCKNLTSVVLPSSIKRIYNHAFSRCGSLKSIKCLGYKAPQIMLVGEDYDDPFYQIASNSTLTVPKGRADHYKEEGWNSPFSIVEADKGVLMPTTFNPEDGKEVSEKTALSFQISFDTAVQVLQNTPQIKLCKEREEYPNVFTPEGKWNVTLSNDNKTITVWASNNAGSTQQYDFNKSIAYYVIIPSGIVKDAQGNTNERLVVRLQGTNATGIAHVPTSAENKKIKGIYTLSGVLTNQLQKGLNLIKYEDGSYKKVLVK